MPRRISRAAGAGASSQGQQRQRGYSVAGAIIEVPQADAGLHVVATPIGNLGDITLRALRILAGADAVICEDSRVSARLLAHYGISTPLVTYHDHNAEKVRPRLMARLAAGDALALITDAGTPLVSDPGYRLVQETIASGIALTAAPGPAAPVNALVLSGLPSDRFFFEGFLPPRQAARRKRLAALVRITTRQADYHEARVVICNVGHSHGHANLFCSSEVSYPVRVATKQIVGEASHFFLLSGFRRRLLLSEQREVLGGQVHVPSDRTWGLTIGMQVGGKTVGQQARTRYSVKFVVATGRADVSENGGQIGRTPAANALDQRPPSCRRVTVGSDSPDRIAILVQDLRLFCA